MSEHNTLDNETLKQDTVTDNSHFTQTEESLKKNKGNASFYMHNVSPVITGIFWIGVGVIMLLMNFFSQETTVPFIKFIRYWGMLFAGVYLLIFALLGYMRKIYFIVGVCSIALWLGHVIESSSRFNTKTMWPVVMMVISVAIILYGVVFKKHKLKSYVITGAMFLGFSLLVFISVLQSFDISQILRKIWPVFLVFLGVSYIYNRHCRRNRSDKLSKHISKK